MTIQHPSAYAVSAPDRTALVVEPDGAVRTYAELDARSNQVANLLRDRGLRVGDAVAVLLENRVEFFEVTVGAMRMGLLVTPINWHLAPDEAAYIIRDSEASALVASATLAPVLEQLVASDDASVPSVRLVVGGAVDGFDDYEEALAAQPRTPVDDQCEGSWMLYSSGTTGRPKGIKPGAVGGEFGAPTPFGALVAGLYGFGEGKVYLSPAPLYHAAPAGWTNAVHRLGGTAVVMDRFDPLTTLELIQRHRVTHVQFVPTHLVRLLKLPEEDRARFDLSSLECVVHAAAPCPPEVKRAALDWLGPIVHEYYSGSEGAGFCAIGPEEWLAHPGSVGRSLLGTAHVTDADGTELGTDEVGQIWFESGQSFSYHGDAEKTSDAHNDRGWSTLGDMGYLDAEGYLYLTDRVSNMIISGGVNIYPREIEDVLILHPAVADVAVVGVADPDMGESVRAVVQLADGVTADDDLESDLVAFARERLSSFKCPRSVVVVDELPRLATGKLAKRLLPAARWPHELRPLDPQPPSDGAFDLMDLALSSEQEQLVDSFGGLLAKSSSIERVRAAEPTGYDADLWAKLVEVGVTAMALDEAFDGWGATLLDLALVAELAGLNLAPAPIIESQVAARLLAASGSPVAAELLPGCLDGTSLLTLAVRPAADGRLPLVPAGSVAHHVIARDGDRLVVVAADAQDRRHVDNLGAQPLADLVVPDDAVEIAAGAAAGALYENAIDEWLTLTAAALVGIGARAQDMATEYAVERRAWGVPIGTFQAVSHPLADSATALDGARLLARKAAWAADADDDRRQELAAIAFAFAAETARDATYRSLHIHGGYGFMLEQDVQLYYRRARGWARVWGDTQRAYRRAASHRYGADD